LSAKDKLGLDLWLWRIALLMPRGGVTVNNS